MNFRIAFLALAGIWASTAVHVALRAQEPAAKPSRSTLDGVYTDEQAKRGEAIYSQKCVNCHGGSLEGADMAPPLNGGGFSSNWTGLTVGDLTERIRLTMPDGDPGTLSRQQTSDVVSYILKFSKFPPGKAELPTETEQLKQIKFEPPKP